MPYENCEWKLNRDGKTCIEYSQDCSAIWCESCLQEKHWREKQRTLLQDIFTEIEKVFDKKIQDLT